MRRFLASVVVAVVLSSAGVTATPAAAFWYVVSPITGRAEPVKPRPPSGLKWLTCYHSDAERGTWCKDQYGFWFFYADAPGRWYYEPAAGVWLVVPWWFPW